MKAFGGLLVTTTAVSPPIESNTLPFYGSNSA
ncbi:hypothetical protein L914_14901 [Phytophthora nicotianae]|uniref:Uncharacterized protein n=1 Tax=Phytophthora nicotianae TaxID=4792 RepID=W2MRB5_PHYNI|nr:hypothetical protein L914_14901 [Phytophthora nicotianae]